MITAYEAELIPRGREEVKCSVENGYMLHDWKQVQQSPVFRQGFKPMDGHDKSTESQAKQESMGEVTAEA